jgi:putative cell wall-binding protein
MSEKEIEVTKKLLLGGAIVLFAFSATVASAAPTLEEVPGTSNSVRAWGDTRYETSLAISQLAWTPDVTYIVFLATGENYPDALSLGASTVALGPILLVKPDAVPSGVAAEVNRLEPCAIVVAGGTDAVHDSVVQALDDFADPTSTKCQLSTSSANSGAKNWAAVRQQFGQ